MKRGTGARAAALIIPGVLLAAVGSTHAETEAQLWTEAGVEHKLSKPARVGFTQHLRFGNDVSEVAAVMPEVFGNYKLTDWLRVGSDYRFEYKRSGSGDFVYRHRLALEARGRLEAGRFEFDARTAWQFQLRGIDGADGLRHSWRNRLSAGTELNKTFDAGISAEMFHDVGDGNGIVLSELRFMSELGIELSKKASLELGLGIELPVAKDTDPTLLLMAVGIEFEI